MSQYLLQKGRRIAVTERLVSVWSNTGLLRPACACAPPESFVNMQILIQIWSEARDLAFLTSPQLMRGLRVRGSHLEL